MNLTKDSDCKFELVPMTPKCSECKHRQGSHSKKGCIFCMCEIKGDFKI